jgi:hypothetical protein
MSSREWYPTRIVLSKERFTCRLPSWPTWAVCASRSFILSPRLARFEMIMWIPHRCRFTFETPLTWTCLKLRIRKHFETFLEDHQKRYDNRYEDESDPNLNVVQSPVTVPWQYLDSNAFGLTSGIGNLGMLHLLGTSGTPAPYTCTCTCTCTCTRIQYLVPHTIKERKPWRNICK